MTVQEPGNILIDMLEFAADQVVEIKPVDNFPASRVEIPRHVYEDVDSHQAA